MDSPRKRAPLPPSIPLYKDGEEEIWGGERLVIHKKKRGKERPNSQVQRTASN